MAYQSIDELQNLLSQEVFGNRQDCKKAAGRALGTFIEIIMFYLLRKWGENDSIAIERPLAEYGCEEITHNVEFTIHPIYNLSPIFNIPATTPITAKKVDSQIKLSDAYTLTSNKVIDKDLIQNACIIATDEHSMVIATPDKITSNGTSMHTCTLNKHPYAMIECKRVGKEGDAKGPQTIEKAKQGAYVAKTTSSLQKVRNDKGGLDGIYYIDGKAYVGPYDELLKEIVFNGKPQQLRNFTLSIGVVSNHGNWFTADNKNKEMKVLAQSYDWLLFLTDKGLSEFITELLISPQKEYEAVRDAFIKSYSLSENSSNKNNNVFTKKKIKMNAHFALDTYFDANIARIENWFNVISPNNETIKDLKQILVTLKNKDWRTIL